MITTCTRSRGRRILRWFTLVTVITVSSLGLAVGYRRSTGNLGTVTERQIYRAAQLTPGQLVQELDRHQIRTVLNLRGSNPDQTWFNHEVTAALEHQVTHISIPLASDQWLSHDQVNTLLEVFDHAEYPMLVHCEFGAERTGLVSALLTLLRPGSTIEDGLNQFSVSYLFLPIHDGLVMIGHIRRYELWLKETGKPHEPSLLRHWLQHVYLPGNPSREYWPCSPYPSKVTWLPGGASGPTKTEDWPGNACPQALSKREATGITQRH